MESRTHSLTVALRRLWKQMELAEQQLGAGDPEAALETLGRRKLAAVVSQPDGGREVIDPLCPMMPLRVLPEHHPLRTNDCDFVGEWVLYDRYVVHGDLVGGYVGYRERDDGVSDFLAADGKVTRTTDGKV